MRKGCGMSMGIGGTAGSDVASVAVALQGAVRGRSTAKSTRNPSSPGFPLGWIDGSFRSRRCSHCFAVSCLLASMG
jgi:hypothetical protein